VFFRSSDTFCEVIISLSFLLFKCFNGQLLCLGFPTQWYFLGGVERFSIYGVFRNRKGIWRYFHVFKVCATLDWLSSFTLITAFLHFSKIRAICANLGNRGPAEPASHTTKFSKTFHSEESLAPVVDGSTNLGSPIEFQVLYNGAR